MSRRSYRDDAAGTDGERWFHPEQVERARLGSEQVPFAQARGHERTEAERVDRREQAVGCEREDGPCALHAAERVDEPGGDVGAGSPREQVEEQLGVAAGLEDGALLLER